MLFTALFTLVSSLLDLLFSLLPSWSPVDLSGFIAHLDFASVPFVGQGVQFFNNFVPLDQVVIILGLMITLWVASVAYKAAVWVLTKAHVLGGSSD